MTMQIFTISSFLLWIFMFLNILMTIGLARRINTRLPKMETLKVGQPAPEFTAQLLGGVTVTLSDYVSKAVAFIFMSPHCEPCRQELPKVQALQPKAEQFGVELLLVSDADEAETISFVNELGVSLPVLIAARNRTTFLADYKANATPSYCLVDAQGKVRAVGMGLFELEEKIGALSR